VPDGQLRVTAADHAPRRQVDAILAHVVDEAFRLALARQQKERHSVQYGRIAQVRAASTRRPPGTRC
jgi:hypothetical protein